MRKPLLNLTSIRAIRELRAGVNRGTVGRQYGIAPSAIERMESTYGDVPDPLLAGIERLLNERERLRRLVSTLMHRNDSRS